MTGGEATLEPRVQARDRARHAIEPSEIERHAGDPRWRVRAACTENPNVPTGILDVLARDPHPRVRRATASSTSSSADLLQFLVTDRDGGVRASALHNREFALADLVALDRENRCPRAAVFAAIVDRLEDGESPAPLLELATAPPVMALAAAHAWLDGPQRRWLARRPHEPVLVALASRHDLGWREVHALCRHNHADVREACAGNPTLPGWSRFRIAGDRRAAVRRALASNPATGRATRAYLLRDPRWDVRATLAARPDLGPLARLRLYRRGPWAVRSEIVTNPATPAEALQALLTKGNQLRPGHLVRPINRPVLLAALTNPNLPAAAVAHCLVHSDAVVRGYALGHPNAPADRVLAALDQHDLPAWHVRRAITHPAVPPSKAAEMRTWLAIGGAGTGDPSFDPVSCSGHPGDAATSPVQWYWQAARDDPQAAAHPLWRVREMSASVPSAHPTVTSAALAEDGVVAVRRRAAQATISWADLGRLRQDADPGVRETARRRFERAPASEVSAQQVRERRDQARPAGGLAVAGGLAIAVLMAVAVGRSIGPVGGAGSLGVPPEPTFDLAHLSVPPYPGTLTANIERMPVRPWPPQDPSVASTLPPEVLFVSQNTAHGDVPFGSFDVSVTDTADATALALDFRSQIAARLTVIWYAPLDDRAVTSSVDVEGGKSRSLAVEMPRGSVAFVRHIAAGASQDFLLRLLD